MAEIVGGGKPVNDAERRVIAYLRDHAPADWLLLHNVEVPRGDDVFEVDLLVLTGHALVVVDVKGTRGRIEVSGSRWFPPRREAFGSPVTKLRGTAKALKGLIVSKATQLERVYVDSLVVLTSPDAKLVDPAGRDAPHVTDLPGLIPTLSDVSRVRRGCSPDVRPYLTAVLDALNQTVRRSTAPPRFGNWEVEEQLGGDARVTEYRAYNATLPGSETVLLRVYQADPLAGQAREGGRAAAHRERLPDPGQDPSPPVRGAFARLLRHRRREPVRAGARRRPRAGAPPAAGQRRTAGRDPGPAARAGPRARTRGDPPRAHPGQRAGHRRRPRGADNRLRLRQAGAADYTVVHELHNVLDAHYVAPECQDRPDRMTAAADVYAAGVIAYQLLTGTLPTSADAYGRRSPTWCAG